jgi:hypothetical protein
MLNTLYLEHASNDPIAGAQLGYAHVWHISYSQRYIKELNYIYVLMVIQVLIFANLKIVIHLRN